jgi:pimeloyl-ACP methyl ester carboxylesterase
MDIEIFDRVLIRSAGTSSRPVWMIHAFGDSGRSFEPLLETALAAELGLMVPDLPGCGASPKRPGCRTMQETADYLADLILRRTPDHPCALVGHSLGASIATLIADRLGDRARALVSIEGNLTEADAYFSGRAADYDDASLFHRDLCAAIWDHATSSESFAMRRYFSSLVFADPETLWSLGRDGRTASRGDGLGAAYRSLTCPTLYCWSRSSTPERTQQYLEANAIPNHNYQGAGHWPMIEIPAETARFIGDFILRHLTTP